MKNPLRRHDTLHLESAPLHTERPDWAAMAPAQATAAFKRGAHVIGFTEVHSHVADELSRLAKEHGYVWLHGRDDTALAYKSTLKVSETSTEKWTSVTFDFHGSTVTVFMAHWPTHKPAHEAARRALTKDLIEALGKASAGSHLAFYMGDSNPDGPLSRASTEPRHSLDAAGFPLAYEALHDFPDHIGVNVQGYAAKDTRVVPSQVETYPAMGSDHIPAAAFYSVRRLSRRLRRKGCC